MESSERLHGAEAESDDNLDGLSSNFDARWWSDDEAGDAGDDDNDGGAYSSGDEEMPGATDALGEPTDTYRLQTAAASRRFNPTVDDVKMIRARYRRAQNRQRKDLQGTRSFLRSASRSGVLEYRLTDQVLGPGAAVRAVPGEEVGAQAQAQARAPADPAVPPSNGGSGGLLSELLLSVDYGQPALATWASISAGAAAMAAAATAWAKGGGWWAAGLPGNSSSGGLGGGWGAAGPGLAATAVGLPGNSSSGGLGGGWGAAGPGLAATAVGLPGNSSSGGLGGGWGAAGPGLAATAVGLPGNSSSGGLGGGWGAAGPGLAATAVGLPGNSSSGGLGRGWGAAGPGAAATAGGPPGNSNSGGRGWTGQRAAGPGVAATAGGPPGSSSSGQGRKGGRAAAAAPSPAAAAGNRGGDGAAGPSAAAGGGGTGQGGPEVLQRFRLTFITPWCKEMLQLYGKSVPGGMGHLVCLADGTCTCKAGSVGGVCVHLEAAYRARGGGADGVRRRAEQLGLTLSMSRKPLVARQAVDVTVYRSMTTEFFDAGKAALPGAAPERPSRRKAVVDKTTAVPACSCSLFDTHGQCAHAIAVEVSRQDGAPRALPQATGVDFSRVLCSKLPSSVGRGPGAPAVAKAALLGREESVKLRGLSTPPSLYPGATAMRAGGAALNPALGALGDLQQLQRLLSSNGLPPDALLAVRAHLRSALEVAQAAVASAAPTAIGDAPPSPQSGGSGDEQLVVTPPSRQPRSTDRRTPKQRIGPTLYDPRRRQKRQRADTGAVSADEETADEEMANEEMAVAMGEEEAGTEEAELGEEELRRIKAKSRPHTKGGLRE
ncbi:hypothetical protein PLESTF_001955800 [Pleodorina starrii]|nr:hypothetical protein PLESTF_001955800 [Pleodorina starrii]